MHTRRTALFVSLLGLGNLLAAQEFEPSTLGVQARICLPQGDLKDTVGGKDTKFPGLGISLVAEQDFTEGVHGRLTLGMDRWEKGDWNDRPGVQGQVEAMNVTGSRSSSCCARTKSIPRWTHTSSVASAPTTGPSKPVTPPETPPRESPTPPSPWARGTASSATSMRRSKSCTEG
jgi:hypothetical protein